jgi:hypothetical protein
MSRKAEAEHYRAIAEKIRELGRQSPLPDVRADLLDLAVRFEEMAAKAERPVSRGRDPEGRR